MEEQTTQHSDGASSYNAPAPQSEPTPAQPRKSKFTKIHMPMPSIKQLLRWSVPAAVAVVIIGLVAGSAWMYQTNTTLSQQNKKLNTTLENYKKQNAKPNQLTDTALQDVTSDSSTQPAPAENGSYGGTAVQVNADDPTSTNPKYVGGEYAPFWLLNNFALTIPDGLKMVRTTDVTTDGHLFTLDSEGGSGCAGDGIYMTVSATLFAPNSKFRANGSSASYKRGLGCGGADPNMVKYVKYYPMAKASQYKYMELVTQSCDSGDGSTCVGRKLDENAWRLYSGLVLADTAEYKVGDDVQGMIIARQLYNRDVSGADFYIDCTGDDKAGGFFCDNNYYKNSDYTVALHDAGYIQLKDIILNMHTH